MNKFLISLNLLSLFLLATVFSHKNYDANYEKARQAVSLAKARNILQAVKTECPKVISVTALDPSPSEEFATFSCGEKNLLIDVKGKYASWTWKNKQDVIFLSLEADVSNIYNTALKLWEKTKEYDKEIAVIMNHYRDNQELNSLLRSHRIKEFSRMLLVGTSHNFNILGEIKRCRQLVNAQNYYCHELFSKGTPAYQTSIYSGYL